MSEEENIEEHSADNSPQLTENNNISEENIQHIALNIQPNEENMEVHKHPHHVTHKKKWGEYLLEFLMLFLAVFLGFVAENFREHGIEKEREKHSIANIVNGLASDTAQLQDIIRKNIRVVSNLDSVLQLHDADLTTEKNKEKFLLHSVVGFSEDWYFNMNDAALQQLKSSGMLRLIRDQDVIDSIFKYEIKNKVLIGQQADLYWLFKEGFTNYKQAVDLSFFSDTTVMKWDAGYSDAGIEFKNIAGIKINADKINVVFGNAAIQALTQRAYIGLLQAQLTYGIRLIAYLKKEYNLENQ